MHRLARVTLALLVSTLSLGSVPPILEGCGSGFQALLDRLVIWDKLKDTGYYEAHVVAAATKALASYDRNQEPPVTTLVTKDKSLDRSWPETARTMPGTASYGSAEAPLAMTNLPTPQGWASRAFRVEIDGKTWIYRPLDRATRIRLAVDHLNQLLALDVSSASRLAVVNGKLGLLSTIVPGEGFDHSNQTAQLGRLIKQGKVDANSAADAEAFEFLVANHDGHSRNFAIDDQGVLRVFDHDRAMGLELPFISKSNLRTAALGNTLPRKYTRRFAEALRRATPEKLRAELGSLLSEKEMRALLFRREVILADLDLRGGEAIR